VKQIAKGTLQDLYAKLLKRREIKGLKGEVLKYIVKKDIIK